MAHVPSSSPAIPSRGPPTTPAAVRCAADLCRDRGDLAAIAAGTTDGTPGGAMFKTAALQRMGVTARSPEFLLLRGRLRPSR